MKTWQNRAQKLLIIHNWAFLELPIRPKIDFPYWKLGWSTLFSFYFVGGTNEMKSNFFLTHRILSLYCNVVLLYLIAASCQRTIFIVSQDKKPCITMFSCFNPIVMYLNMKNRYVDVVQCTNRYKWKMPAYFLWRTQQIFPHELRNYVQ